jgi:phosphoglycerol transferase MdoB-like AlkP superfamily enzyme
MENKAVSSESKIAAFIKKPYVELFINALIINLILELLSRFSLIGLFKHVFTNPLCFIYNTLLIYVTFIPALAIKKRDGYMTLMRMLWIAIGIIDFITLRVRVTPFSFVDILIIGNVLPIWHHYISIPVAILIVLGIIAVIAFIVYMFLHSKSYERRKPFNVFANFIVAIATCIVLETALVNTKILAKNFGNLVEAYQQYGLAFCFTNSVLNMGISKPKDYSDDKVENLVNAVQEDVNSGENPRSTLAAEKTEKVASDEKQGADEQNKEQAGTEGQKETTEIGGEDKTGENAKEPKTTVATGTDKNTDGSETQNQKNEEEFTEGKAEADSRTTETTKNVIENGKLDGEDINIIFLQLESFFDPTTIKGSTYTEDPLPNYHKLMEEYTSGKVNVPVVGAGTCNTEFEMITGMSLDFFGPGEYPYKTLLLDNTCESAAYILKDRGYKTHAVHNNSATFYARNQVFANLGFDTFTSIEYMKNVEYTPLGWAKDYCLTDEIKKTLSSTEEADYIYAISVQGHGAYPTEALLEEPKIGLTLPEGFTEERYYGLLYYVNEINEMDEFVGQLTQMLEQYEEPVALVMYGDHLPSFQLTADQLTNGNLYQTDYVIWTNFKQEVEHKELEAYQLYSYLFGRIGIKDGIINAYHQIKSGEEDYQENLELLEYDLLYGEKKAYNGETPYKPTKLKLGIDKISASYIKCFGEMVDVNKQTYMLFVYGTNFNTFSKIKINGEEYETMFVSENVLSTTCELPKHNDMITVVQKAETGELLSESDGIVVTEKALENLFPKDNPVMNEETADKK